MNFGILVCGSEPSDSLLDLSDNKDKTRLEFTVSRGLLINLMVPLHSPSLSLHDGGMCVSKRMSANVYGQ